jgi:ArsR family transcriptional regulator
MTQVRKQKVMTPKQASACCGPIDDLLDPTLFKALCDPTRVRIVACLIKCGRACSVSEVAECCDVDFSVVSRHLQMLGRAGVVEAVKAGRTMSYIARYEHLAATLHSLADAIETFQPSRARKGDCCGTC